MRAAAGAAGAEAGATESLSDRLGPEIAAGLLLGTHWTRAHDQGKDLAAGGRSPAIAPVLPLRPGGRDRAPIPTAGFRVSF